MRLILLGVPGAGKGTQSVILAEKFKIPHVSTGDIFRSNIKNATALGKKAEEYIDKGLLVPDEVTIEILKDRIQQDDCINGFILDGFPRTIPQAEYLGKVLDSMSVSLKAVIYMSIDDGIIIERLSGRRTCPNCGKTFNVVNSPSKAGETCDKCNEKLVLRHDDEVETVKNRLETFRKQTEPLIEYYREKGKLVTVDAANGIEGTTSDILKVLGVS